MYYKHKPIAIHLLLIMILFSACKKEHSNNNTQGQLSFTLNGTNYSYTVVPSYDSISSGIYNNMLSNSIQFGGINQNTAAVLTLIEEQSLPGYAGLDTGFYASDNYDTACMYYGGHVGCHTFDVAFTNGNTLQLISSYTDSTGALYITSFDTTAKVMSGYFTCQLMDGNTGTTFYNLTNGRFTNVPFYFVH